MQTQIHHANDLRACRTLCLLMLTTLLLPQAVRGQDAEITKLGDLPPLLKETSGLELTSNDHLWTMVDDRIAILYGIDLQGKVTRAIHLNNVNIEWEDLAQDELGNLYIGDFGNNRNTRRNCKIYKLPPPDSIKENIATADIINYTYPDQKEFPPPASRLNFDMEAMVSFGEHLYLFSKNRTNPFTGYARMYRVPNTPGTYVAELMDSVYLGPGHMYQTWVTGADISPDKKTLALLTHDKVWLFHCFPGDHFFKGTMTTVQLNHFSQKEGICFSTNTELYISDELTQNILGGCLYRVTLNSSLLKSCP